MKYPNKRSLVSDKVAVKQIRSWLAEKQFRKIQSLFAELTINTKTIVALSKEALTIQCNLHPKEPDQVLSWNVFFRLLHKGSKTFKCAQCIRENQLQTTIKQYKEKLKKSKRGIALVTDKQPDAKIDSKKQYWHRCEVNPEHPDLFIRPYEVLFKKKRCPFCYPNISYRKDYDFVKQFVEMDSDRLVSHFSTFKLLSSKREFIDELARKKNVLKRCRLTLKQNNCSLHSSFIITWHDFAYRNRSCTGCSKDFNVSYAHRYFEALLTAFAIPFIPELTLPVKEQTLRTDFYLPGINKYVEIDGLFHKKPTALTKYNEEKLASYQRRDQMKEDYLGDKLIRLKLYQKQANGKYTPRPTNQQINMVIDLIKTIYKETYKHAIKEEDLQAKQADPNFFQNARAQALINKLHYVSGGHYRLKNEKDHLGLIKSKRQTFICTRTKETFERNIDSVLNKDIMLCPCCAAKAKKDSSFQYREFKSKIINLNAQLIQQHDGHIQFVFPEQPFKEAMVYITVVPKVRFINDDNDYYISLHQLMTKSTKELRMNALKGRFSYREIKKSRASRNEQPRGRAIGVSPE